MLKRKIYKELLCWKENRRANLVKEALLIKGARQVGKTFLIKEFGKAEYESFYELNFIKNPELKMIFDGALDSQTILKKILLFFPNIEFKENNTLIFLDEIQVCSNARTAIKFLALDFRFDVISSGSLLGLAYFEDDKFIQEPKSLPVGYEAQLVMHSLDFEEFLWAMGYQEKNISLLKELVFENGKIDETINNKYESLFLEYIVVGGMPEVVDVFAKTNNFNEARKIQEKILNEYNDDIAKHAKGVEKVKIRACYDSLTSQLSKERTKFQYSLVEKGQTSKKYFNSIQWLRDSCIVNVCNNVTEPYIPLLGNIKIDQFKLYMHDTGLLIGRYGYQTCMGLLNNTLVGNIKGGIFENVIAECLVKKGYKLYYYHPSEFREIEFLVEKNGEVLPIEVKSSNGSTVSLNSFIIDFKPSVAYKLINGNKGIDGVKVTVPHYIFALFF